MSKPLDIIGNGKAAARPFAELAQRGLLTDS